MIKVENLYHDYEKKGKYAVENISFEIGHGQIFGFLGPSGAGKSTVQNIMTGLIKIQKGNIYYENQSIKNIKKKYYNNIGYSFEHPNIYTKLTGYENLKYYAGLFSVKTEDPIKLLEMVGLKSAAYKRAGNYSKGMKQRLVFARSLINNPRILFLDEPTSGLDPATAAVIKDIIMSRKKEGTTIFLTTHNMHVADELCDLVAFLIDGKIILMDSPRNLKLKYGQKAVKVEISSNSVVQSKILFTDNELDKNELKRLIDDGSYQTIHSQEATLDQIFLKITGRELI